MIPNTSEFSPPFNPYFALISGVLAVSTGAIFARLVDAPALVIAAYRPGFAMPAITGFSAGTFAAFWAMALISQLIGHTSYNWALKWFSASLIAISLLGEPFGSTILAYLLFDEGLTWSKAIGGIIILSAINIAASSETKTTDRLKQTVYLTIEKIQSYEVCFQIDNKALIIYPITANKDLIRTNRAIGGQAGKVLK
jgi:hypothetical protein